MRYLQIKLASSLLSSLEISMRTNVKEGIQESLESLDQAINQVILARSEVGSRLMSINHTNETLQKSVLDSKALASQLEDADVFQTVSDINKAETTLKAVLETGPKMVQPPIPMRPGILQTETARFPIHQLHSRQDPGGADRSSSPQLEY